MLVAILPQARAQNVSQSSQSSWEFDLNSDGSAKVTFTSFVENDGSTRLSNANLTLSQGTFNVFVHDLLHGHDLDYHMVTYLGSTIYTLEIFFQPVLEPTERTVIQITYDEVPVASLSKAYDEALQGIWVMQMGFPQAVANFRLTIKLPPYTEPWTLSVTPPNSQIYTLKYVDTDNRWVIVWLTVAVPPSTSFQIKYRIATRLWVFAVAPALTLACFVFVLRIIRPRAARHARESDDKVGAYTLWQMSLGIHLAVLAAVVGSWGLLLSQEVNPSIIDIAMLLQLAIVVVLFFSDTKAHEAFIRSFRKK